VDLTTWFNSAIGGVTVYNPDLDQPNPGDNRDTRFAYPMRIPVTTSNVEYSNKSGKEPIAHYSSLTRQLTINVPNTNSFLSAYDPSFDVWPLQTVPFTYYMNGFQGTFVPLTRNDSNNLILSNFAKAHCIAQVSETVTFTGVNFGTDSVTVYPRNSDEV